MLKKPRQFKVLIEQDEDGFFVANVPALPGCQTQAKNLPELKKRIREAVLLCLDVAKDDSQYRILLKNFAYEPIFVGMETISV